MTVFVIACFVGYYVIKNVTPALHSPLMSVTNAISSVVVVGGVLSCGIVGSGIGAVAVLLMAVNIVGGFALTSRMLAMFAKR